MRSKSYKRLLAILVVTAMVLGNMSAFATDKPSNDLSATLNNAEAGYFLGTQESSAAVATNESRMSTRDTAAGSATSLSGSRNQAGEILSSNAQYVADVAAMLTESFDYNTFDNYADSDVIEVMVWLQELPDALERIYLNESLDVSGYSSVAANAAAARAEIKAMGSNNLKSRNTSAIQIQYEYSEIFAGFAITASVAQINKIAAMPGVFTVTEMAYYEPDYIPDPDYNTPGNRDAREIARIGELHAMGIDGTGVKVGVIDSGIQTNHPEFAENYKGGWNFVFNNSNMNSPDGDHGTHVSGTIASTGIESLGVAPGVELYMAQVFDTYSSSSGSDAVVTAAMEAYASGTSTSGLPKVDVVNMSLGIRSPDYNSAYVSGVYARNNLVLAGVTLVCSGGNSAYERDSEARQPYTTTSSNASLSIAVASSIFGSIADWNYSSDLGGDASFVITASNSDKISSGMFRTDGFGNTEPITVTYNAGNTGDWLDAGYYGTYTRQPLEYVEGLGYEIVYLNNSVVDTTDAELAAWKAANPANSLVGKLLAVNRGISFSTMYSEAVRTGAAGVIMIDRDERSTVNATIRNVPSTHGVIFQTGVAMRQILLDAKNAGTIYFDSSDLFYEDAIKEFSIFSSIGPTMENAHIKPDITAPGDDIYSTSLNSGYTSMGGTSMASPFVAGCAALLIQQLKETEQDASPEVVKARLMNTADPYLIGPYTSAHKADARYYYDDNGTESSVYEQGSGFVNVYRAIFEDVYVTVENTELYTGLNSSQKMTGNMASISFGDVYQGNSKTLTATVHGLEDYDVAVSYNHDTRYSNKNLEMLVSVDVVKNGDTFDVTVTVGEDANADKLNGGNLYEGYVTVTGNGNSYVLPWAVRANQDIPPPPPGESPDAKITLIADSSLSMYTPTIGVSMWFDDTNQMYDLFMTEEGVEFVWMNENCVRVPESAVMGGSVNTHLLIGQTKSVILENILENPRTFDILSVAMQNTSTFIGGGEFRALKEHQFEAGYEYVIIVTGDSGGNPSFNLQEMKPYDGEVPDYPGEADVAKITLIADSSLDIYNPVIGASMWFDGTNQMYDLFMTEEGVEFVWMNENCVRVPESAVVGGSVNTHLLIGETASIILEPDTYDILSVAMQNANTFIGAGDFRALKAYEFKAGYEYVFIVTGDSSSNPVFSLYERKAYDGEVITVLEELDANITAPRGNKTPQATISSSSFSGTITWMPADARFQWETDYTASVTLTPKLGYEFGENISVTVPGSIEVTDVVATAETLTFNVSFPNTGEQPPYATVIALDLSGGYLLPFSNLLAFDSTCTAVGKIEDTGSINFVQDFDVYVPAIFAEDNSTLFVDMDSNDEVPAGTYDYAWRVQNIFASGYTDYGTTTLEAYKTYLFVLNEDWEIEITELVVGLDSFTASPASMLKFGGSWRATATGYFNEDFGYEVYRDGELFASGMFAGNEFTKTASIAIPENNTGVDQVYTLVVPHWEGDPNYEQKTLVVSGEEINGALVTFEVGDPYGDGSGYVLLFDSENKPVEDVLENYDYVIPADHFDNPQNGVYMDTQFIVLPEGTYAIRGGNYWNGTCFTYDPLKMNDFEVKAGHRYVFTKLNTGVANWIINDYYIELGSVFADAEASKLYITLAGTPTQFAPVTAEDFDITWVGGMDPEDADQALTNFEYDIATGIASFDFAPFTRGLEDRFVVFTVGFRGETMDSNEMLVPRLTPLDEVVINYITPSAVTVAKGKTVQLYVETDPYIDIANTPGYSIVWKSLMPTVASVNATGLVTGKSIGQARVQATITDPYGGTVTLTYTIIVK